MTCIFCIVKKIKVAKKISVKIDYMSCRELTCRNVTSTIERKDIMNCLYQPFNLFYAFLISADASEIKSKVFQVTRQDVFNDDIKSHFKIIAK